MKINLPAFRPFDDQFMVYDFTMHKYVLTPECVLWELGENLDLILNTEFSANPSTVVSRFLKRVSNSVYNFVYDNVYDDRYFEFIMAMVPQLRERIHNMLLAQVQYFLDNGQPSAYSGINFAKGTVMDIRALRGDAKVADEVVQEASRIIPGLGHSLLYGKRVSLSPCLYRVGY